jgi:hypothetical protein
VAWSGVTAVGLSGSGVGAALLGGGEDCCTYSRGVELSGACACDRPIAAVRRMTKTEKVFRIPGKVFLQILEYGSNYLPSIPATPSNHSILIAMTAEFRRHADSPFQPGSNRNVAQAVLAENPSSLRCRILVSWWPALDRDEWRSGKMRRQGAQPKEMNVTDRLHWMNG